LPAVIYIQRCSVCGHSRCNIPKRSSNEGRSARPRARKNLFW